MHRFYVDNNEDVSGIFFDMIIGHELIVQLGLLDKFKRQGLQQDGITETKKKPIGLLDQTDLTNCKTH